MPPKISTAAWARACKSGLEVDWLNFRQSRNKFTSLLRKAKSEFYFSTTTESLENPKKFWKTIRSLFSHCDSVNLPPSILVDGLRVSDRRQTLNYSNNHFISSGFISNPDTSTEVSLTPERTTGNTQVFARRKLCSLYHNRGHEGSKRA